MLRLSGTATASGIVSLFDGASLLGLTKADTTGAWSFVTGALSDGAHSFMASVADADGNKSDLSGALTVVVNAQAPAAPVNASFLSDIDSGHFGTENSVLTLVRSAETDSFTSKITNTVGDVVSHSAAEAEYDASPERGAFPRQHH